MLLQRTSPDPTEWRHWVDVRCEWVDIGTRVWVGFGMTTQGSSLRTLLQESCWEQCLRGQNRKGLADPSSYSSQSSSTFTCFKIPLKKKKMSLETRVPWLCSGLRIQCCHRCGMGSFPDLGTSICHGCSKKKKKSLETSLAVWSVIL